MTTPTTPTPTTNKVAPKSVAQTPLKQEVYTFNTEPTVTELINSLTAFKTTNGDINISSIYLNVSHAGDWVIKNGVRTSANAIHALNITGH